MNEPVCYCRKPGDIFECGAKGKTRGIPSMPKKIDRNSLDRSDPILDATNLDILRLLIDEPRLPMSELGRRVGMSAPAVAERVQRLQDAGVIRGARLDVDQVA